ncbi:NUDIX hydrolase [Pontibacillus salicampi]|uniref:NUDIX hydrolase n=1 Tax=Pontibacillus salicampi TaxID=1449801 RepID=A0ABV6LLZ5_9BACI
MNRKSLMEMLVNHTPSIIGDDGLHSYALLLPLMEREDGLHLLFEVRSYEMRRQPGEICFPGGKQDADDADEKDTAVREATEELGVAASQINDVHSIGYMVSPFGMKVEAYAGVLQCTMEELTPNKAEVAEVFTVPLSFFLEEEPEIHYVQMEVTPEASFPFDLIPYGENYQWPKRRYPEYFYYYQGRVIWGLTARILHDFVKSIQ